jgi:hypothetical protein
MKNRGRRYLYEPFLYQPGKMLEGTIIGSFGIIRKTTGRQFPAAEVISKAVAAGAFSGARFITAVTVFLVFLHAIC